MIYFDSNDGDPESGFILWFPDSVSGLDAIPRGPREGLEVDICMPNELIYKAHLKFDAELGHWRAMPIPGTVKIICEGPP